MNKLESLKSIALKGSMWTIIEKFSIQIVNFIVGIILARLLGPPVFGLIALTTIFMTICGAITDGGFEKTLIKKIDITDVEINTTFYLNIALGIIMALVVYITAPYISAFFNEPQLTNIFRVLCIILPIDALGQTQRTLLIKELDLKKNSYAQIAGTVGGSIVGLLLAFNGFGVWALVMTSIVATTVRTMFFWIRSSWYPKLIFSYSSISNTIPFGIYVLTSSVLFFFLQQFNNFIVGKFYGKADLGLFNRGLKFPELVIGIIQGVVIKMSFPLFAKLQDDNKQQQLLLEKTIKIVAFIAFPLLAFLFINAHDIIFLLLTSKWEGAIIFLQLFCIVKLLDPFISIYRELILANGYSRLLLKIFILISILEIIPMIVLAKYGIMFIVIISMISKFLQFIIYTAIASKKIDLQFYQSVKWLLPYLLTSLIIAVSIYLLDFIVIIKENLLLKLILKSLVGAMLYLFISSRFKLKEVLSILTFFQVTLMKKRLNVNQHITTL